ncbi:MAG: hypothetical protein JRJ54_07820 [Deltaproteobacteria bacterium]|nr:hypothetical protein [Deltaproteobacteria bacterium]
MKKLFVVFIALAMVGAFSLSAAAADWSFYGSSRMTTFWDSFSTDEGDADDDGLTWALQGNSRIGANVKTDGPISGRFEYGTGINLRLLYGQWDTGSVKLLFGQTYSPVNIFISNQVWGGDSDMLPFGGVYGGRRALAQMSVAGFKVALVQPVGSALGADGDVDYTIPKIEASYVFSADKFKLGAVGGYNAYDVEASSAGDYDVTSYVVGAFGQFNFGPAYVNANVWMGQNAGNYGLWNSGADDAVLNGSTVEDTDSLGFLGVVGFKVSDMLSFEGGYGQVSNDNDTFAQEDETAAFYVQAVLKPAKGVKIIPEVGFVDYMEDAAGADEGDNTYFGAQWRVDF